MATRNKAADEAYNARRRYARAGVKYLRQAKESSGATAARYKQLAKRQYEAALKIYGDKPSQRISANIRELQSEFDPNRDVLEKGGIKTQNRQAYIEQSVFALQSSMTDENARREREARTLLNDDVIGSRILGGLVDVWKDKATIVDENGMTKIDNKRIVPALLDYFKVTNLADMVDKLEESIGSSLYELKGDLEDIYENVRILIAEKVRDNTLVS